MKVSLRLSEPVSGAVGHAESVARFMGTRPWRFTHSLAVRFSELFRPRGFSEKRRPLPSRSSLSIRARARTRARARSLTSRSPACGSFPLQRRPRRRSLAHDIQVLSDECRLAPRPSPLSPRLSPLPPAPAEARLRIASAGEPAAGTSEISPRRNDFDRGSVRFHKCDRELQSRRGDGRRIVRPSSPSRRDAQNSTRPPPWRSS
jgi:hypothetical protein